jgi:hypothetical protein
MARPLKVEVDSNGNPVNFAEFGTSDSLVLDSTIDLGLQSLLLLAGSLTINLNGASVAVVTIDAAVTSMDTDNRPASGSRFKTVVMQADGGGPYNLTFNGSWKMAGSVPPNIGSNETGILRMLVIGSNESDVIAWWYST